jgi:hypothetical protein
MAKSLKQTRGLKHGGEPSRLDGNVVTLRECSGAEMKKLPHYPSDQQCSVRARENTKAIHWLP